MRSTIKRSIATRIYVSINKFTMSLVRKQFTINESSAFECWIFVIRHTNRIDEFWFKSNDVAEFLEYKRPRDAIKDNVNVSRKAQWCDLSIAVSNRSLVTSSDNDVVTPSNWHPHTVFINESGLYALVLRSKKAEAISFQNWVMTEVLPSLRRTGQYFIGQTEQDEPMDTSPAGKFQITLLQKYLELEKLKCQLMEKEKEIQFKEKEMQVKEKEAQIQLMNTVTEFKFKEKESHLQLMTRERDLQLLAKDKQYQDKIV